MHFMYIVLFCNFCAFVTHSIKKLLTYLLTHSLTCYIEVVYVLIKIILANMKYNQMCGVCVAYSYFRGPQVGDISSLVILLGSQY